MVSEKVLKKVTSRKISGVKFKKMNLKNLNLSF